jgi:tRNA (Thr-GGU) A37 N-methylase
MKKSTKIEKPNHRHRKDIQKEANAFFSTRSSSRPLPIRVFRTNKQQQQIAKWRLQKHETDKSRTKKARLYFVPAKLKG